MNGEYLFVLTPDQARIIANAILGVAPGDADGELSDIELSSVAEAMNQVMAKVSAGMSDATGVPTEIAPPTASIVASKEKAEALGEASYTARFTVRAGTLSTSILVSSLDVGDRSGSTTAAVEHSVGIVATSAAEVLTTLLGELVTATTPAVEQTDDPLGGLAYPRVMVEIPYLAGVEGGMLFVLAPQDSATLAGVMMGLDAPMGDGLSELELSAVAEAMSQMMGTAATALGAFVGRDVEIAPPVCTVVDDVASARSTFPHAAHSSRCQIVSERITAEVLQLLPADVASHLEEAFASSGSGAAGMRPVRTVAATASTNAAAARTTVGSLSFDSLRDVQVRVSAEFGRARVPVSDVMNLPPGAIVELDRTSTETIDILVNGRAFARARLVLVDGEYAAQIVSLEPPTLMVG